MRTVLLQDLFKKERRIPKKNLLNKNLILLFIVTMLSTGIHTRGVQAGA